MEMESKMKSDSIIFSANGEFSTKYVPILNNNVEQLKLVLKTLAQVQSEGFQNETKKNGKYEIVCKNVSDTLEMLQSNLDEILNQGKLVESLWSPDNVFLEDKKQKVVFLRKNNANLMPPLYDALLYIFSLSDERFRQKHFAELTNFYFNALKSNFHLDRIYMETHLGILLPVAKMKIAFELPTSDISANLSRYYLYPFFHQEDVYEVLTNKFGSADYELIDYALKPLSENNGHLGDYYHLKIEAERNGELTKLNLFSKIIVGKSDLTKEIIKSGVGAKEDFFYSTLCPLYRKHGLEKLMDFAPECYLSRLDKIVLNDLSSMGFIGFKPNETIDHDGLKIILTKLAKFHSCSLILEEILGENLDKTYQEYLKETVLTENSKMRLYVNQSVEVLYYCLSKFPDLMDKLKLSEKEIRDRIDSLQLNFYDRFEKSKSIRNVINHGDMYVANMLFKFSESKAIIDDGVLIDFQLLRYLPPAFEVLFFILLNSDPKIKKAHFDSMLQFYHRTFSQCLKQFDLDANEIYSKKHFEDDVKFAKPVAVIMAFVYGQVIFMDDEFRENVLLDTEKSNYYLDDHRIEMVEAQWKAYRYEERIRSLMEELVDLIKS